jgi:hypothetical protein
MAPDKYQVQKKLLDLGRDVDDVAAELLRLGCKGRVGSPTECSLAKYLGSVMEPGPTIEVQSGWVDVDGLAFVDLPPACEGFAAVSSRRRLPCLPSGGRKSGDAGLLEGLALDAR